MRESQSHRTFAICGRGVAELLSEPSQPDVGHKRRRFLGFC
jgi:hypothetical protein